MELRQENGKRVQAGAGVGAGERGHGTVGGSAEETWKGLTGGTGFGTCPEERTGLGSCQREL